MGASDEIVCGEISDRPIVMDYDRTDIPTAYDRGRHYGPEYFDQWMEAVASGVDVELTRRILDLGCGTGRFSETLGRRFGADVCGLDPSRRMLVQARAKGFGDGIRFVRAKSEEAPFSEGAFDLIFMSMVFHHLGDPCGTARECRRMARNGATLFVRTGTRERITSYPFVPFFPSSLAILEERVPRSAAVREAFESAGFRSIRADAITQLMAPSWSQYADRLAQGADSFIQSLDESERQDGLEAMRDHAAIVGDEAVYETVDFMIFQ